MSAPGDAATTAPAISVVVATRDRPAALERCLIALAWQNVPELEIVIVDDGSTDPQAVRAAVADAMLAAAHPPRVHVVQGEGRGPAAARNLGARAASGPIVLFTDDDCVSRPRWAQLLATACAGGGAAAGVTVADPGAGRAAAASQLLTHTLQVASLDPQTGNLGFAPTCNLGCHAEVLRRVPFDESFPLAAGEDRDWCSRLAAHGIALRFVPGAGVEHRPQMGIGGLLRQQLRYGRGAVRFRAAGEDPERVDRVDRVDRVLGPAEAVGRRLAGRAFYGRLAGAALQAGPATFALVALAQAAVAAGVLLELGARRRE